MQCLTSIRVSASRHSYGKTAAIVRTMCDPVRMMSSIRQVMHIKFNRPNVSLHGPNDQASYMELHAPVQPSGHQPSGFGRSKPYYGNYMQPKCNHPDARATLNGRCLVMEAFSAILKRRLQLTVRTLS
jgi:hypothetical protein